MKTEKKIAAGILLVCYTTGRILLCRRGLDGGNPNCWATFGGTFESDIDSNPKETAKREFREETEYSGPLNISKSSLYVNKDNHLTFYNFLAVTDKEFTPVINEESLDSGWFYLGEMPENLHPGLSELFENKSKTIKRVIQFYHKKT